MPIEEAVIRDVSAALYNAALRKVPDDTLTALKDAQGREEGSARLTLDTMIRSAAAAEADFRFVCSDAGIPVYFVKLGSHAECTADIRGAIREGFDRLVETISPPLLMHVTNPLTQERGYKGKDMPITTFDVIGGVDYIEITCSPSALGSGRWSDMQLFTFPSIEEIEEYILSVVFAAGSQPCPPVVLGIGIGGTFDYCAKMAKAATLRPVGSVNPDPTLAAMEKRLLDAVNETGFGPMGVGGVSTAQAVHVDYAAGHGYTPVAVSLNCWINRRTTARLYNDGRVERTE